MKVHRLERKQFLPISIGVAWSFFSDPRNLELITPPDLRFEITSLLPDKMHAGLIITYKVRPLLNIAVTWVAEISHLKEPYYFVDRQISGPYRLWHHTHNFREIEHGTEMIDRIHYTLPFWGLGDLLSYSIVNRRLDEIFNFRQKYLEDRFGTMSIA